MELKIKKIEEMNEQDKELLLKDLCARLPYGVKVAIEFSTDSN